MDYRVLTKEEQKYTFRSSTQIMYQTGLIGFLRAGFVSQENEFYHYWHDLIPAFNTPIFKNELDNTINVLRKNGFLKNPDAFNAFCNSAAAGQPFGSEFGEYGSDVYGIRTDTDEYSFLMRLIPKTGDYNLFCFCYKKDSLESHIKEASKGIRFSDSDYNTKFTIPDGGSSRVRFSDGTSKVEDCRYIDEYHAEIGNSLYHICQYAEICERNGITAEPCMDSFDWTEPVHKQSAPKL